MEYVNSRPRPLDQTAPAVRESRVATVLVVDDSAEVRQQLRLMLEDMGHAVVEAPGVQQALALVRQAAPDMILSAIQIPGVDGFELCRQLQQDPTLRHVPTALITDEFRGPDKQRFAKDVGAVAVLKKPVTPQDLRAVVDVWLCFGSVPDATQKLRQLDNEDFHKRHSMELIAQLETKVADLERLSRRYKLLSETNHAIVRIGSREELLRAICRIAVEHGDVRLATIVLADQADRHPLLVDSYRAAAGSPTGFDDALNEFANAGRGFSAKTIRSGKLLVVNDIVNDPTTVALHETARRAGIGAMVVVPLRHGGVAIGALEIYACTAGFFGPEILRTFEEMAEDIAFGLHNHAREADHVVALQRTADALEYNRVLIESSPIGIITYNAAGGAVSVNAAAARIVGGTVTQLASQNFREIESWKSSGLLSLAEQALASNRIADKEIHIPSTTYGKEVWIRARLVPFEFRSERHLLALLSDICERHAMEQALAEAQATYRALVEQQSLVGIFLVDGDKILYHNPRADEIFGYQPGELVGKPMKLYVVDEDWPAVERAVRAVFSGEIPIGKAEFRGRRKDGSEVLISAHGTLGHHNGKPILIGVLLDITEQKRAEQQIKLHVAKLEAAFMHTVEVATTLSEMRDPYTAGHERRVAEIAVAIGAELGFDAQRLQGLRIAGNLHDVGKMSIPSEILSKPGKLSDLEFLMVKGHPQASYEILKKVEFPWPVAQVALQHHERMDGSGYPQGLKGEEILLEARIMSVADVVEAMSSHRPYRAGLGIDKALAEIERGRGSAYDPVVVDACLKLFRNKGYEFPQAH
ncbi:MAG: HD domain-containing phosphohydrolase [Steroidobacterales bacterium]